MTDDRQTQAETLKARAAELHHAATMTKSTQPEVAAQMAKEAVALDAGARALRASPIESQAEIDAAWFQIDHGWDIESREELEKQSKTNGFKYGLAQAIHHLHKRCVHENPDFLRASPVSAPMTTEDRPPARRFALPVSVPMKPKDKDKP